MNREVIRHFRRQKYSESSEYTSSCDELTDSDDKYAVLDILRNHGERYVDNIQTALKKVNDTENRNDIGEIHFDSFLDEGSSCILENTDNVMADHEDNLGHAFSLHSSNIEAQDCEHLQSTKTDCFHCAKITRVSEGTMLKTGSHIRFGRYAPVTNVNNFLKKHLKGRLGFPYYHHAIVTEIICQDKHRVSFNVVQFTTRSDQGTVKIEIVEDRLDNIDVNDEFLFMYEYKQLPFTADEIVNRARSLKGCKSYDIFTNNCEHVALWCVTNIKASFQSDNTGDATHSWFTWFGAMMAKVSHITPISKDIASATKSLLIQVSKGTLVASVSCPIVCAVVQCILLLRRLRQLKTHLKRRLICLCCFNKKKLKILAKLLLGFAVSIVLLIPTLKYCVPIIGVSILTLIVMPWACEKLITKIKRKINPTSTIPQMIVHSVTDIQPGDILSLSRGLTTHDVIVEKVKILERVKEMNTASIDIVHYAFCGLLGTRTVVAENLNINLDKERLFVYDFPDDRIFSSEAAIHRAKQRVGERKFNMIKRRSSHMVWECKVLPNVETNYTKRLIKSKNGVNPGDVIEYKYCFLPHVGIVVDKTMYKPADIVELTFVHVNEHGEIVRSVVHIDLENEDVYVQIYDESEIEENPEVIRKAKRRIGEKIQNRKLYKSSHFALECKLKAKEISDTND